MRSGKSTNMANMASQYGFPIFSFLSLLLQQKSVHCRVVATKFYKTKIPSLIIVWLEIQDIFILVVGVLKVTVIQILVNHIFYIVYFFFKRTAICLHIFLFFFWLPIGMRMASGSHMMSYNANPHSYQTSHVSRLDVLFSSNHNIH